MLNKSIGHLVRTNWRIPEDTNVDVEFTHSIAEREYYEVTWWEETTKKTVKITISATVSSVDYDEKR